MSCCCHRMLHTEKARRDGRNNAAADCIITPHALCTPPIHHGPPILCHVAFQVPLLEGNHISYLTEAELGYRTCCSGWNVDRSSRSQSGYEAPGPGSLPFLLGFLGEHALQPVCTPAESHTSQLDDIAATPQTPHTPSGANPKCLIQPYSTCIGTWWGMAQILPRIKGLLYTASQQSLVGQGPVTH